MEKIALLFPGQGSQYVKMGKALCDEFEVARETFKEANDVLGFDLQKLCFEGSIDELTKTENAQPAILTASVAAFRVYMKEVGITPALSAGHSLGEYSALTSSGAIKFSDALRIVRQRGRFMQEASSLGLGGMSAVGDIDKSTIEDVCKKASRDEQIVVVSNINSPNQIVISGHKEAVHAASEMLKEMGAAVTPLKVSAPFHCPLMQPAAVKLNEELKKYTFSTLAFPVISNVSSLPYAGHDAIIGNLTEQMVKPVQWLSTMEYLKSNGITMAIEMGPQTVLRNLMKKSAPEVAAYSYDKKEDVDAFMKALTTNGMLKNSRMPNGPTLITRCMAVAVCTRNRNWDNVEYQKGVTEPYRKIQQMQDEIEKNGSQPTVEQMAAALEMLRSVFITKKTPVEEQVRRFNQVFDETGTRHLFPDFKMPS